MSKRRGCEKRRLLAFAVAQGAPPNVGFAHAMHGFEIIDRNALLAS
jgi:hypothetical protein